MASTMARVASGRMEHPVALPLPPAPRGPSREQGPLLRKLPPGRSDQVDGPAPRAAEAILVEIRPASPRFRLRDLLDDRRPALPAGLAFIDYGDMGSRGSHDRTFP